MAARIEPEAGSDRLRVVSRDRLFELFEADLRGNAGSDIATYDAHPDGERFAIVRGLGAGNEVVLCLDWLDEVKALLVSVGCSAALVRARSSSKSSRRNQC